MVDDGGYGGPVEGGVPGGPGDGAAGDGGGHGRARRRRLRTGLLTHAAAAVLAAGLGVGLTLALMPGAAASAASATAVPGASAVPAPAASSSSTSSGAGKASGNEQAVVNKVEPGLVTIDTKLQYNSEAAAGTGMVINADGLVLTNNHVIEDSTKITATVVATGKTYPAKVVGYDKTQDVALIQLTGASGLRTVPIGNSSTLKTGSAVVGLGNAEGQGSIIPAAGKVTALGKTITATDQGGTASTETLHGMIQTSADIVPGDSGGPLADSAGDVVGMDTAGNNVSFTQQVPSAGFAIPIDTALSIARQIAAGHASAKVSIGYPPFMGIFVASGSSSNPQTQAQQQEQQNGFANGFGGFGGFNGFGAGGTPGCYTSDSNLSVPSAIAPVSSGALIDGAICGSPAASAGMTGGSVITAVNSQAVGSPASLNTILSKFRPGDTISVTWTNPSGQSTTSSLRLVAGPPQ